MDVKELQSAENDDNDGVDAGALSVQAPPPPRYDDGDNSVDPGWALKQELSASVCATSSAPSNDPQTDQVEDTSGCATPRPTQYSRLLGNGSSECSAPLICTTLLYSWHPAPSYGDQPTSGVQNTTKAMRELKEMEQLFQTDTKQRISQMRAELLRVETDLSREEQRRDEDHCMSTDNMQG